MPNTILLLDADGTQTLPVAKALCRRGDSVAIFYENHLSYGVHSRYVKDKVQAPSAVQEEDYFDFLETYLRRIPTDVVIPLGDDSARILSKYKTELSPLTRFLIPDYTSFTTGYDKNALMHLCAEHGFPHPTTVDLEASTSVPTVFPALIKPNVTTGGRGMTLVTDLDDFRSKYPAIRQQYGPCHLQEYIPTGGRQIKVQLLLDKTAQLVCSSVIHKQRYYPENGGSSCCNTTIVAESLVRTCYQVLECLHWVGFADFDLIEDPRDGVVKIMEINPRIPACVKSAVRSGADYGSLITDLSLGKPISPISYQPGYTLRHIGFEMLWFYYSHSRFKTSPNWFRFCGRRLCFQDFEWSDPLPFLYGTWGNIKKQFDSGFRATKSGLR